jgi:hypothetical protein
VNASVAVVRIKIRPSSLCFHAIYYPSKINFPPMKLGVF